MTNYYNLLERAHKLPKKYLARFNEELTIIQKNFSSGYTAEEMEQVLIRYEDIASADKEIDWLFDEYSKVETLYYKKIAECKELQEQNAWLISCLAKATDNSQEEIRKLAKYKIQNPVNNIKGDANKFYFLLQNVMQNGLSNYLRMKISNAITNYKIG